MITQHNIQLSPRWCLRSLVNIINASKAFVEKINTRLPARVYFFNSCFWLIYYVDSTSQHQLWLSGCYIKVVSMCLTVCNIRSYDSLYFPWQCHWLKYLNPSCQTSRTEFSIPVQDQHKKKTSQKWCRGSSFYYWSGISLNMHCMHCLSIKSMLVSAWTTRSSSLFRKPHSLVCFHGQWPL